jgi:hypothetical protein
LSTQDPTPPPPPGPPHGAGPGRPEPDVPSAPQFGQVDPRQGGYGEGGYGEGSYGQAPGHGQAQGYGQGDPYGSPAPRNGLGLAALVVGILSIVLGLVPVFGVLGFLGVVAVILGIVGLSRVRKGLATNRGAALTGLVLGVLSVVLALVWTAVTIWGVRQAAPLFEECSQPGLTQEEVQACVEENLPQP